MKNNPPSERARVRRASSRGFYDKETIYSILDEGLVCHVGFILDGQPFVIPKSYARAGDHLIIHGSMASQLTRAVNENADICVAVSLLDGLVLARSAFFHTVNYRSVVVFGKATLIEDEAAKLEAFRAFFEHTIPGRWDEVRKPTRNELAGTAVIEVPLDEASAKIRTGPPADNADDRELSSWAGVIPLELAPQRPLDDPELGPGIETPDYVAHYERKKGK